MTCWPVQDAKARFSEMLNRCVAEGPQIVTRRGSETAVLIPMSDWKKLCSAAGPSRKEVLTADYARGDIPIPDMGRLRLRPAKFED